MVRQSIYEDAVGYEQIQTPQETAVRAELEITERPETHQLTYRWHERHFQGAPKARNAAATDC